MPHQVPTILIVTAAPKEAAAIARGLEVSEPAYARLVTDRVGTGQRPCDRPWSCLPLAAGVELLETGVGKVNAAAAVAKLFDPERHLAVLNLGVCGMLPTPVAPSSPPIGLCTTILAERSVYADEGILSASGFVDCAAMGFPLAPFDGAQPGIVGCKAQPRLSELLITSADTSGTIATVSTCSGTDDLAAEITRRTGAIAEAMEGAAIAHTLSRLLLTAAPPFAELRVVSNTTGDRALQRWDLPGALLVLGRVARSARDALHGQLRRRS